MMVSAVSEGVDIETAPNMFVSLGILGLVISGANMASAQAYDYHRTYKSPYYLGRGDTGIAVADEQHAVFYNPAGIAQGKSLYKKVILATPTLSGSTASRDLARKIEVEKAPERDALLAAIGKPQHFGVSATGGIFLRRVGIAGAENARANILVSKSRDTSGLEVVRASLLEDRVVGFSLGENVFSDKFSIGTSVKIIQRTFADLEVSALESNAIAELRNGEIAAAGIGYGVDLGLMYRSKPGQKRYSLGLTVSDVGDTLFAASDGGKDPAPILQTLNLGLAYEVGPGRSKFRFLMDYRDLTGALGREALDNLHLGAEISMADYIGFTLGLSEGYWSGGGYLDVRFLRFDVGAYTKEVGSYQGHRPDTRFFFQISVAL